MSGNDLSSINIDDLIQLLAAMNAHPSDQALASLDSDTHSSLDLSPEFCNDLYKSRGQQSVSTTSSSNSSSSCSSSVTSLTYDHWPNSLEQKQPDIISQLGTAQWAQQGRTPITRSHSAVTNTLPTSAMTSQWDLVHSTSQISSLPAAPCSELKSQHRSLARTASDPVTAMGRVNGTVSVVQGDSAESCADMSSADRYKTELCRTFQENGKCKYGDKCQFAHGRAELRNLSRHPKYKTDRCKTYHSTGFCPYGPRCHFIHDENERPTAADENKPQQKALRQMLQQKQQQQQQQIQQQQQQLLQALLAKSQNNVRQTQGTSKCDLSGLGLTESSVSPAPSALFNSTLRTSAPYSDSLGSLGSPTSSVPESPSLSPTLSMFEDEQADRLASRSGPLELNDWSKQILHSNQLSSAGHGLNARSGINSESNNPLAYSNLYSQYPTMLNTFPNSYSPLFNLPKSDSLQPTPGANRSAVTTLEDILLIAEVLKAIPSARAKYSVAPYSTSQNFDRLNALTGLTHFPSSGLVL